MNTHQIIPLENTRTRGTRKRGVVRQEVSRLIYALLRSGRCARLLAAITEVVLDGNALLEVEWRHLCGSHGKFGTEVLRDNRESSVLTIAIPVGHDNMPRAISRIDHVKYSGVLVALQDRADDMGSGDNDIPIADRRVSAVTNSDEEVLKRLRLNQNHTTRMHSWEGRIIQNQTLLSRRVDKHLVPIRRYLDPIGHAVFRIALSELENRAFAVRGETICILF